MAPSGMQPFPWDDVLVSTLQAACPEQTTMLQTGPPHWSDACLSRCIFGRPDWGLFVSMFACLWKEAVDAWPDHVPQMEATLESKIFVDALKTMSTAHGSTPCPMKVLQQVPPFQGMLQYGKETRQKLQEQFATPKRQREPSAKKAG